MPVGRAGPRLPAAREVDPDDSALAVELRDETGGVAERALGDLRFCEIAEVVEDPRELVGVARPPLGRGLLELRLHQGDDLRLERPRRHAPDRKSTRLNSSHRCISY